MHIVIALCLALCAGVAQATTIAAAAARDGVLEVEPGNRLLREAAALIERGAAADALPLIDEAERVGGDRTEVLFLRGLAVSQLGDHARAIDLFKAILAQRPGLPRVRLELARAEFNARRDEAAERDFNLALAADLPAPVVENVYRFLDQLRTRRRFGVDLMVAIAPDTNINRGPTTGEVVIYDRPFTLDDDAQARSGVGVLSNLHAFGDLPLAERVSARGTLGVFRADYPGQDFDDLVVMPTLGPRFAGRRTVLDLAGLMSRRWYGGRDYSTSVGAQAQVEHRLTQRLALAVGGSARQTNHDDYERLDGPRLAANLEARYALSTRALLVGTVGVERELTEDRYERNTLGLFGVGASIELPRGFVLITGPVVSVRKFDHRTDAFGARRRDVIVAYDISVLNRRFNFGGVYPGISFGWERRLSTIDLYEYDRLRMAFSLRREL